MNELAIILTLVVVFLGLFIGIALAFIAPEELRAGRKYFKWFKTILLLLMIAGMVYFGVDLYLAVLNIFMLAAFYMFEKEYWVLGFVLLSSNVSSEAFFIQSALAFVYGLPEGTLFAENIIKKKKTEILFRAFKHYNWFLVFSIIMFLISLNA